MFDNQNKSIHQIQASLLLDIDFKEDNSHIVFNIATFKSTYADE